MKLRADFRKYFFKGFVAGAVVIAFTGCNDSTAPATYTLPKRYFKDSVEAIFNSAGCTSCHDVTGPGWNSTGGNNDTGLALTYDSAFSDLVNKNTYERQIAIYCTSPDSIPLYRVRPGSPDSSFLYHKISEDTPACGDRMPAGGYPPLTEAQIAVIKKWIQYGAPLGDTTTH
jgi:hypothetical protein